jgi:hypothetical protein
MISSMIKRQSLAAFLDRGADINATSSDGETLLALWKSSQNAAVVSLLLDKGLSIKTKGRNGETPIFYANKWTLPVLLQRGANDFSTRDDERCNSAPLRYITDRGASQSISPVRASRHFELKSISIFDSYFRLVKVRLVKKR